MSATDEPVVTVASRGDAAAMVEVIHAAFGARPPLDPPSTAVDETPQSIVAALEAGAGVYATVDGRPAGAMLLAGHPPGPAGFARVAVHPDFQRHGIASSMVAVAEELAATVGHRRVELFARGEFAELVAFWQHRGFEVDRSAPHGVVLAKELPTVLTVPTADDMRALGVRLAALLQPGDLLIATGDLGAGKTTLTQGLGAGLGTTGAVISPTFVLSRMHPSATGRPTLVHADAYRLGSPEELDDLDLDATVPTSVTVVEWGAGLAEQLAPDRLEVQIALRPDPRTGAETRRVALAGVGGRWAGVDLAGLRDGLPGGARG